jgi:hypothetical protein
MVTALRIRPNVLALTMQVISWLTAGAFLVPTRFRLILPRSFFLTFVGQEAPMKAA